MTVTRPRWEGDTRGRGDADARSMVDEVIRLEVAARRLDWVAENPDEHLLPGLREACASLPGWSIEGVGREGAAYVVTLGAPAGTGRIDARAAAYHLVARVAEPVTFVRERRAGDDLGFDVLLGHLEGDSPFEPHGHVLRLVVPGAASS